MGDDEIAATIAELDGDGEDRERFGVWPENWPVLLAFLACRRCWLVGALGGFIGWNYPALETRMRLMKTKNTDELLPLLEVMGDAALPLMNRRDD